MITAAKERPTSIVVLDVATRSGRRFLKRVASGREGWRLACLPRNEWRVAFIRDVGYGEAAEIVTSERVVIERPYREADSREFVDVQCCGAWLLHGDAETAARLMLGGWTFRIRHHPGSEAASDLRLHVVEFTAVPPFGGSGLSLGGVSIVDADAGAPVVVGACSVSTR